MVYQNKGKFNSFNEKINSHFQEQGAGEKEIGDGFGKAVEQGRQTKSKLNRTISRYQMMEVDKGGRE